MITNLSQAIITLNKILIDIFINYSLFKTFILNTTIKYLKRDKKNNYKMNIQYCDTFEMKVLLVIVN